MRRLLVLCLLFALAAPAAAWALTRAPGDGTLAVRNGSGRLQLTLQGGAVIGKIDAGRLQVTVPASATLTTEETCSALKVWGADRQPPALERAVGEAPMIVCRFTEFRVGGTPEPMRLRLVEEDRMLVKIDQGRGFSVSAVAKGSGYIEGAGGEDGTYSVNGRSFESLPDSGERFVLRTATLG